MDHCSVCSTRGSLSGTDHEWQTSLSGPAVLCPGHPLWSPVFPASCLSAWSWSLPHPHRLHQDPLFPMGPQGALGPFSGPGWHQASLAGGDGVWAGLDMPCQCCTGPRGTYLGCSRNPSSHEQLGLCPGYCCRWGCGGLVERSWGAGAGQHSPSGGL